MEETKNTYRILVGRALEKGPLERSRKIWDDNIKVGLRELTCEVGRWME
jgi:hypothetical protein